MDKLDNRDVIEILMNSDFDEWSNPEDLKFLLKQNKAFLRKKSSEQQNNLKRIYNLEETINQKNAEIERLKLRIENLDFKTKRLLERVKKKLTWKQRITGRL